MFPFTSRDRFLATDYNIGNVKTLCQTARMDYEAAHTAEELSQSGNVQNPRRGRHIISWMSLPRLSQAHPGDDGLRGYNQPNKDLCQFREARKAPQRGEVKSENFQLSIIKFNDYGYKESNN